MTVDNNIDMKSYITNTITKASSNNTTTNNTTRDINTNLLIVYIYQLNFS